ncbi:MAG: DUF6629 family protein [Patescibacteria group bacterium]
MCFSATASFTASAALLPIGAYALSKARPKDRLIASVPVFFGLQQGIEGLQWLYVGAGTPNLWLGYAFLFFAFLFWPWFIPLAISKTETNEKKRRIIFFSLAIGFVTCLALLAQMFSGPLVITVHDRCLQYGAEMPMAILLPIALGYLFSACITQFVSSHKYIRLMGYIGLAATAFSFAVYWTVFTSVWCFFAAVISGLCLLHVLDEKKADK